MAAFNSIMALRDHFEAKGKYAGSSGERAKVLLFLMV